MSTQDTSGFFTTHQTRDVPRDQYGRYKLPGPDGPETSWTRATTFAATLAEQYGLRIWKERQVVWGLSRRPDLMTLASTIVGPEDKKALGAIVDEAHIAAGTEGKANRGTAIHLAIQAAERSAFDQVPEELRPHVANYLKKMAGAGLEILREYVERTVVIKQYGVAGTFDNLVRCPDGKIRVSDKKTGRLDYSDTEFAVQLALYANADAMFNYDTNQYEQLPEIATDYAILAHIDPETGHCELHRINIEWGWVWARTCAEVRDIRQTKHVITPYIPDEVRPENREAFGWTIGDGMAPTAPAQEQQQQPVPVSQPLGTVPGGYVDSTSPVPPDFQAFWTDDRHFTDDDTESTTVNGVPVAQYGQPSTHPCARGESCEFTGDDGLHQDGTVCLYGNARPGPVPPLQPSEPVPVGAEHANLTAASAAAQQPDATPQSVLAAAGAPVADMTAEPDDAMVARILATTKSKAKVQSIARRLMDSLGVKETDPDGIRLSQYQNKIASAVVTLAFRRQVPVPGPSPDAQDFGVPSGPGNPDGSASGKTAAQKATGAADATEVSEHTAAIRTAIASINQQTTIQGLANLHSHYSTNTRVGWTDEMQNAARTRAAEIEATNADPETPLTPLEMIQGATSRETLTKAWEKATNQGSNMSGWTEELNAAAMAKQTELAAVAASGN